jgi:DNA polymerase IIIc chi subunit
MMDDQEYAELVNRVRDAERAARLATGKWKRVRAQEAVALWLDLRRAKAERERRAA